MCEARERFVMGVQHKVIVKVKKLHPDAVIPQYAHEGNTGFDLVAVDGVTIRPGRAVAVATGLAFEIPPGYEMQLWPPRNIIREFSPLRIVNSPGPASAIPGGEVKVLLTNSSTMEYTPWGIKTAANYPIYRGDIIAQGVIKRVPMVELVSDD